jgi:CheY-like chemotaxis protein
MGRRTPLPSNREITPSQNVGGILVIDDDVALRRDLCEALETEGYPVVAAAGGADAIRWLRSSPIKPSLILLDLVMEGVDGREFRAWMRKWNEIKDVPIVIITGMVVDLEALKEELGAVAALPKPLSRDALFQIVKRLSA